MSLVTTLQHRELQPGVNKKKIMRCNCGLHARTLSDLQHNKHVYDRRLYFGEVFIKKIILNAPLAVGLHSNCNQVSTTITTGSIRHLQL